MAIKVLHTPAKIEQIQTREKSELIAEEKVQKFISQGGGLATTIDVVSDDDHRLTLRIPKQLLDKIDAKRKQRVGTISRNLWILEIIDKATQK
ncbi:hypothetical protein JST56_07770 [Candidatus Dependentiae bacterium]|nr:hypothetical protein [Candidatus Dependentiae bacterium]